MLKALELENFKAFGQRTRIEFAPITLIFGENSAGKSSILQSLNLLKQTRESREHGALLLPRSDIGTVDLGSFQELLFDHDQSRVFSIRLMIGVPTDKNAELSQIRRFLLNGFGREPPKTVSFELQFAWPHVKNEVALQQFSVFLDEDESELARFIPVQMKKGDTRRFGGGFFFYPRHQRGPADAQIRAASCSWITRSPDIWRPVYKQVIKHVDRVRSSIVRLRQDLGTSPSLGRDAPFLESAEDCEAFARETMLAEEFYKSDFSEDAFTQRIADAEQGKTVMMDGFIPVGPAGFSFRAEHGRILPEQFAAMRYGRGGLSGASLDVDAVAVYAGQAVDAALGSLFPMGPFRRPPERWYIYTGSRPQDVGYKGELLPDLLFRTPDLVKQTNDWLKRLDIGYEVDPRPVGTPSSDLFEVRLRDLRRKTPVDVALSDVGFGISQLLPFVVQALATQRQIISIEQPEVHIHPRLQADLGDLLAEAISEPYSHRFIIETHSEHLVLRLQRLVHEKKLSPSDVAVIFVSRGADGARTQRLRLDDEGDFIDQWPGGFFSERLRELT